MSLDTPVVVVPTYNEAENIAQLACAILQQLPNGAVLVVDDCSPDHTAEIAESCADSRVKVHRRCGPRGLGRAYREAFQIALSEGYDPILQMDADFSHDPAALPDLLATIERADVAIGSRYVPGGGVKSWPLRRVLLSRYANVYVRIVTGINLTDATSGYRCWRASALRQLDLQSVASEGYAFAVELAYRAHRAGLTIEERPIVFTDRKRGRSKMSGKVIRESIWMPWRLRLGAAGG